MMSQRWKPSQWAGWMPNSLGQVKPNHYLEILNTLWSNRDQLPLAWRSHLLSRIFRKAGSC